MHQMNMILKLKILKSKKNSNNKMKFKYQINVIIKMITMGMVNNKIKINKILKINNNIITV